MLCNRAAARMMIERYAEALADAEAAVARDAANVKGYVRGAELRWKCPLVQYPKMRN